jgi:uncharacterized membrane protein (UPF0136 family)
MNLNFGLTAATGVAPAFAMAALCFVVAVAGYRHKAGRYGLLGGGACGAAYAFAAVTMTTDGAFGNRVAFFAGLAAAYGFMTFSATFTTRNAVVFVVGGAATASLLLHQLVLTAIEE